MQLLSVGAGSCKFLISLQTTYAPCDLPELPGDAIRTAPKEGNETIHLARLDTYTYSHHLDLASRPRGSCSFAMPGLISATGVLAFLADEEPELKVYALKTLNDDVDTVWTEVAGSLSEM